MTDQSKSLNLADGHLCYAGREALNLHKALGLAYRATHGPRAIALRGAIDRNCLLMAILAKEIDTMSPFFKGNLPTSLRFAVKAWTTDSIKG